LIQPTDRSTKMCIVGRVNYTLCTHTATYVYFCRAAVNSSDGILPCNDTKWPINRNCRVTHCSGECCADAQRQFTAKIAECDQMIGASSSSQRTPQAALDYADWMRGILETRNGLKEQLERTRNDCGQKCRTDSFRAHANIREYEHGIDDMINVGNPYPLSATPRPGAWIIVTRPGAVWRQHPDWPRMRGLLLQQGM
jgi:hypothetical protein